MKMELGVIEQKWCGNGILTTESSFWKVGLALPRPQSLQELLGTHEVAHLPRKPQDSGQAKENKSRVWRQLSPKFPTSLIASMPHKMGLCIKTNSDSIFPCEAFFVIEKKFEKKSQFIAPPCRVNLWEDINLSQAKPSQTYQTAMVNFFPPNLFFGRGLSWVKKALLARRPCLSDKTALRELENITF